MNVLVVSPHLDDAVLSCGQLLAAAGSSVVVTVFAGVPPSELPVTDYDVRSGWVNAQAAVIGRRLEDDRATSVLGVDRSYHLAFFDRQYAIPNDETQIIDALAEVFYEHLVRAPVEFDEHVVFAPVGLLHPDHAQVSMCARAAIERFPRARFVFYEDLPGRVLAPPREIIDRLTFVEVDGHFGVPAGPLDVKEAAVACYRSQAWALNRHESLVAERYWNAVR
jgi:LmbE family N-acetylglucosaminyl deacetylase